MAAKANDCSSFGSGRPRVMPDKLHSSRNRGIALLITLPVFVYALYRAGSLSFTYDECWTFLGYASADLWSIVTNAHPAANNHILHSLMMKISSALFGDSEFVLRIPALVGMIIYVRYAFGISKRLARRAWWVPFILLLFQPYLIDYFSIARGYSLAMGFMLGALFHLDRAARKGRRRSMIWTLVFAFLATYSNFTYILLEVAVIIGLAFALYMRNELKRALPLLVGAVLFSSLVFFLPLKALVQANELYYGGSEGFITDTLGSLGGRTIYSLDPSTAMAWVFSGLILLSLLWWVIDLGRGTWKKVGFWAVSTLLLTSLGSMMQHWLMGSPFLIDRTAMFLLPLLILSLSTRIFRIQNSLLKRSAGWILIAVCVFNTAIHFNVSSQLDFKEHSDTEAAVLKIAEMSSSDTTFDIGKSRYMNATIMFYKRMHGIDQINPVGLEFCDERGEVPFYYLFANDTSCVEGKDVELIQHYEVSDTYLYATKAKEVPPSDGETSLQPN